jgi:glycosyltransferase involved in cell wall biosynthesis
MAMLKVLGFALYGPLAASTRYRLGQYMPGLAAAGIELEIHSLLGDAYLRRKFEGSPAHWGYLLQMGFQRLAVLLRRRNFDVAILHCELFPLMPGWLERLLLPSPYIYDFDDAFFLKYRTGRMSLLGPILGDKFDTVIEGAAAITPGNSYLADYARGINSRTYCLPTVVDTSRYVPLTHPGGHPFTVGWVGSPSTAPYLVQLMEPLFRLGQEGALRLVVVGGKAPRIPGIEVEEVAWSEATEVDWINRFDVGVMPLPDDDWARGKCAFKLIQYMACGVPVVASRVGANQDVVTGECGFLAADAGEWIAALRQLRDQPGLRASMGKAGRERIVAHFSLAGTLPRLAQVIRMVAGQSEAV